VRSESRSGIGYRTFAAGPKNGQHAAVTAGGGQRDGARVVLLCGLAGSGKTTYAQALEAAGHVRLSIDEEIWSRFGRFGIDYEPARYAELSAVAEEALREKLVALVEQGRDVVVDFSFWQRAARDHYKGLVEGAGGSWCLIYLKVDQVLLRRRLLERSAAGFEEPFGEGEEVIERSLFLVKRVPYEDR